MYMQTNNTLLLHYRLCQVRIDKPHMHPVFGCIGGGESPTLLYRYRYRRSKQKRCQPVKKRESKRL